VKGTVGLRRLRIDCIVGIHPHERDEEQPLFLDVELDRDFAKAADSESVVDTVDYSQVASLLSELALERRYQLIETFAEEAAVLLLQRFTSVLAVRITIEKPQAVPAADAAFVRVERERSR